MSRPRASPIAASDAQESDRALGSKGLRLAATIIGALLLAAALIVVWRQRDAFWTAFGSLRSHSPGRLTLYLLIVAGSVAANLVLSGLLFSALISRYGKVGLREMQALIASATLMNFVPMRPGFFGRIAYHKAVNGIAVIDSTKTVMQAMILSALIAGYFVVAVFLSATFSVDLRFLAFGSLAVLVASAAFLPKTRIWLWAASARHAEVLVASARYFAVFALIGSPIDFRAAVAFACVNMIAGMVPFFANGLGLREWAIGLVTPLVTDYRMELGMTADLAVNRAVELIVVLAAGLAGIAWLAARSARHVQVRDRLDD